MNCSTPENSTISSNFWLDLAPLHSEDRAVQEDVLPAGELGMEAGAHLEQAPDAPADLGAPARRRRDPREDLEERRLPGAVLADDAEHLAFRQLERDVPQRPDLLDSAARDRAGEPARPRRRASREASRTRSATRRCGTASKGARSAIADAHQIVSAKRGSERRKYQRPTTKMTPVGGDADERLAEVGRGRADDPPLEAR